ncbi:MAG: hypothetical protein HY999_00920 [Nitrospinae bacterium]|nr:hypothetical protein [Nitrospinota bacterium]
MFKIPRFSLKVWLVAGLVVAVLGMIPFAGLVYYTIMSCNYCLSCHSTGETPDIGGKSLIHPDDICCYDCHAQRGQFITGGYNPLFSADAERINPNCKRCHQDIITDEQIGYKFNKLNITIPHKFHIEGVGAGCTDCHNNIAHDWERPPTNRPRMDTCLMCHEREETSCNICHPKGSIELPRSEHASISQCRGCHHGFAVKKLLIYNINFSHASHMKNGIYCDRCHSNKEIHGEILYNRVGCLDCHHKEVKVECNRCHIEQVRFRNGESVRNIKGEPGLMARSVGCEVCHRGISEGHSIKVVKDICVNCHEKGYSNKVDLWQGEISDDHRGTMALLAWIDIQLRGINPDLASNLSPLIDEARALIEVVDSDGSKGVHNFRYSKVLLSEARKRLLKVKRMISKGLPEPEIEPEIEKRSAVEKRST